MYSNIVIQRQWSRLACICRYSTAIEGQKLPQPGVSSDGISPPPRKVRGPTDLLDALATTIRPDPTAAHYKYHDDPYLIPLSNFRKRAYALSAEAGRRAAVWIRDNHSEWFTTREWDPPGKKKTPHFNADPHINAYAPKPIYTIESQVTQKDLEYTITNALMEDSIQVFQLLGGVENVNEELKMKFLQLLCFYNEKEPDPIEWIEERWFSANNKERQATTWKLGGLAEQIFNSMEPKTPEAYCALIKGMSKYYQAERAHMLAQEATEKGIKLSTDVYNSLLSCIGFLREGTTLRIEALKSTLVKMNEQGVSVSVETLSSCMRSLSVWGGGPQLQGLALQLVADFREMGVRPNLATYYFMLCLFCKERGPRIDILSSILNDLEKRDTLEAIETADTNFFITAMGVCSDHLQDISLAARLHSLLMKGDNYRLVGDAYKESIYYRHYVTIHCRHAPIEKTLELMDSLIPNVYVPEPTVMEEIIKVLEVGGLGDRLSQSWSQLVVFGHAKRVRIVERLLAAMVSCYGYQDDEIKEKMSVTALDILKFNEMIETENASKDMRTPQPKLSSKALCDIASLCAQCPVDGVTSPACWEGVWRGVAALRGAGGTPTAPALTAVAKAAIGHGHYGTAAAIMTLLAECGFEEVASTSVELLSQMLNRPKEEIVTLLKEPRSITESLHPSAAAIFEAYHAVTTGTPSMSKSGDSSSSDSESSDDD